MLVGVTRCLKQEADIAQSTYICFKQEADTRRASETIYSITIETI